MQGRHRLLGTSLPFRSALIALLAAQTVLAVGLVGYVTLRNARHAVHDVAAQMRDELASRIEQSLAGFLTTPQTLLATYGDLLSQGVLDPGDAEAMAQQFWIAIRTTPSVTSLYFANTRGGITNAGREGPQGTLYKILTDGFAAGTFRKWSLDGQGQRVTELRTVPGFDARSRNWYSGALAKGGPTWSPIYLLFSGQDMAISASRPVVDAHGEPLGVIACDLFLSQVSDVLRNLRTSANGHSFIIERSGLLVASSGDPAPFARAEGSSAPRRLAVGESSSPAIAAAGLALAEGGAKAELAFSLEGERHFLQITPLQDEYGLDWLIGVVIPERDFMAEVNAGSRLTLLLVIAAGLLAVAFGAVASRLVTEPVRRLEMSAQAVARGEWHAVEETSRLKEIAGLSRSFNAMTRELERTVTNLEAEIAERARTEERLRDSEARYRLLADNATDVIWTIDMAGRFTYVSPSVEKLRGYSPEEVMKQPMAAALTPESMATAQQGLAMLRVRAPEALAVSESFELEQPCKNGDTVWTETVITPLFDSAGMPIGVLGVSRDITARKKTEQERRELEAQLRQSQKLESIGTLASGVAHEVNNPLTGIINYADLIEQRIDDPKLKEYAQSIMAEGQRVAEIVRGLLSFARQEPSERRATHVPDALRAALALIRAALRHDHIEVATDIPPDLPAVLGNAQQIQQILLNLLANARDALDRKYPGHDEDKVLRIAVRPLRMDERMWVRTTIEDHGVGVPAELLGRIFDPFFTTKPRDAGTGLGLSISYGIAKDHGGELWVESEEGHYTRFHLDLPAAEEDPTA